MKRKRKSKTKSAPRRPYTPLPSPEEVNALVTAARSDDRLASEHAWQTLYDQHETLFHAKCRQWFVNRYDSEATQDLYQEVLPEAVRTFDLKHPFSYWLMFLAHRRAITLHKKSIAQWKDRRREIPMDEPCYDYEKSFRDFLPDPHAIDPADEVQQKEDAATLRILIKQILSPLEQFIFQKFLEGYTYEEIAQQANGQTFSRSAAPFTRKSVDNALNRARNKINRCLIREPALN